MDSIALNGLRYHARHGYYEEEREKGNEFEVDLVFSLNLKPAGKKDYLSKTVNYEEAETIVRNAMEGPSVKLIETLAHRIGEELFDTFTNAQKLEVRLRKINPPLKTSANHSEVRMTWQR
ncbi:MAG: dihydroneopterin aldolase [Balneolaceae bacterium]|nr:dihydroneopterin aldolase [Balneolaceae bacterium]